MKTFAVVGFTLLAFAVWWPAGVALLLFGIWQLGAAKEKQPVDAAVNAGARSPAVPDHAAAKLLAENRALKHELNLREAYRINDAIGEKVDEALADEKAMNPRVPEYHGWQIIHDITHDLTMAANEGDAARREAAVSVLAYIERACDRIVRLACTDERWSLYKSRELSFEDFREMRGLAHVVIDKIIGLAVKGGAASGDSAPTA